MGWDIIENHIIIYLIAQTSLLACRVSVQLYICSPHFQLSLDTPFYRISEIILDNYVKFMLNWVEGGPSHAYI